MITLFQAALEERDKHQYLHDTHECYDHTDSDNGCNLLRVLNEVVYLLDIKSPILIDEYDPIFVHLDKDGYVDEYSDMYGKFLDIENIHLSCLVDGAIAERINIAGSILSENRKEYGRRCIKIT